MRIEKQKLHEQCEELANELKNSMPSKEQKLLKALEIAVNKLIKNGDEATIKEIIQMSGIKVQPVSNDIGNGIKFLGLMEKGDHAGLFVYEKKTQGDKFKRWAIDPEDKKEYQLCINHAEKILEDEGNRNKFNLLKMKLNSNPDGTMKSEDATRTVLPEAKH